MLDDELAALIAGQLPADQLRAATDHLDGCERCRRVVSVLAVAEYTTHDAARERGSEGELSAGDALGRFSLTRPLGRGSMGEVWAAHDPELDREVALKLLRLPPGALGAEATVRLRREAQAMARLNHPNVVAIYELGADRDRVFCAMELVDGVTLRQWLATPRPWRAVVDVAVAIGRGIAAAHAVGLIHRDIKPENVLIASGGRTLVSDFGLAKLADLRAETIEADHTADDVAAGDDAAAGDDETAERGDAHRADHASADARSEAASPNAAAGVASPNAHSEAASPNAAAGVASPNARREAASANAAAGVASADARSEATSPKAAASGDTHRQAAGPDASGDARHESAGDPRATDATAASPLGELTATGAIIGTPRYMAPEQLARRPADARSDQFAYCVTVYEALFGARPFTGDTLDDIARSIDRGPPRPSRRGAPAAIARCLARGLAADPAARWPSLTALVDAIERAAGQPRRRTTAALIGGAAVAVAAAAVIAGRTPDPLDAERTAADARIATAWNPATQAILRARFFATGSPLAGERAATTIRLLDVYRAAWTAQRIDAWSATHVRAEQTPDALGKRLACFDQLADAMSGLVAVLLAPSARDVEEAPQSVYRLDPPASCAHLERRLSRAPAPDTPAGAAAERELRELEAIHRAGRYADALKRAPTLVGPAFGLGDPALAARARYDLGLAQATGGKFTEAEATLRRAVQDAAAVRDHYLVAECWVRLLNVVGYGLVHRADAAAIEPAARAAVAQAGGDPRQLADLAKTLGLVAASQSEAEVAFAQFTESRSRRIAARGADDPSVATEEANLGAALIDLDRGEEAVPHFEHAIAIVRASLGEHHPAIVGAEHNLSTIYLDRNDLAEAERHARAAVAMNLAISGTDYRGTATNRIHLARILREQHRYAEARTELDLAGAALRRLPPTHPSAVLFDLYVAQLDDAEGHTDAAIERARRAVDAATRADIPPLQRVWAISQLADMVAKRTPRDALPLYDEALTLYAAKRSGQHRGDLDLLRHLADAALRAAQPDAALRWFDQLPDLARQLPDLRRNLERARPTPR